MRPHALALLALLLAPLGACQASRDAGPGPATEKTATAAQAKGARYTLKDNGKRCFAAPCDNWTATDVATGATVDVAGIDLAPLGLSPDGERLTRAEILEGRRAVRAELVPTGTGRGANVPSLRAIPE